MTPASRSQWRSVFTCSRVPSARSPETDSAAPSRSRRIVRGGRLVQKLLGVRQMLRRARERCSRARPALPRAPATLRVRR